MRKYIILILFLFPLTSLASYWGEEWEITPHTSPWNTAYGNKTLLMVKLPDLNQGLAVVFYGEYMGINNVYADGLGVPDYYGGSSATVDEQTYTWKMVVCSDDEVKFYIDDVLQVSGTVSGASGWTRDSVFYEGDYDFSHSETETFSSEQSECGGGGETSTTLVVPGISTTTVFEVNEQCYTDSASTTHCQATTTQIASLILDLPQNTIFFGMILFLINMLWPIFYFKPRHVA